MSEAKIAVGNVGCQLPSHETHFRWDEMSDKHPQIFRLSSLTQNRFQQLQ